MTEQEIKIEEENSTNLDNNLRPGIIDEFIGQKKHKNNLRTFIQGAKQRGESLDHVVFHGPPGLGKTTLSNIIAAEMGVEIKQTSGPVLDKKGDLTAILTDLEDNDILFIDEIHRIKTTLEEILYKAMEDYQLDIVIGQGVGAKNITIDINKFTLIGATTRIGLLSAPMRDRFGIDFHLDFYSKEELMAVVIRSAKILNVKLTDESAEMIALRSRGTPRIANKLLRRMRDFAQVEGDGIINNKICQISFEALDIDRSGFDELDRRVLLTIIDNFSGGPVGLSTLATSVHEEKDTIEDVVEPYLVQQGYLQITPRGRVVTEKGFKYFKKQISGTQRGLF